MTVLCVTNNVLLACWMNILREMSVQVKDPFTHFENRRHSLLGGAEEQFQPLCA